MATKKIIVTGIGGNVGQGIIRNIKALDYDVKIAGTNVTDFSAGNYLCDTFYKVPYAFDAGYIEAIIEIVNKEKADLIIPSTDFETFYLSKNSASIPCKIAVSGADATRIYLDKYETWKHHNAHGIPFAASLLPSSYSTNFKEYIVKPKKGRGSRGIYINPKDLSGFSDEEYMVQELHRGEEITTAFYVTNENKLLGCITMSRTLENGMTNLCKVVHAYDDALKPIIEKMIQSSVIRGSANIQSIVTADGQIMPFEVNCRISGTNSIRSNFGFKDIQYTLQEFLFGQTPDQPVITSGVAVRVLLDVIYPDQKDFNNISDNSSPHYIF
jgi:carbamoyl-phosphate synthase large subunit